MLSFSGLVTKVVEKGEALEVWIIFLSQQINSKPENKNKKRKGTAVRKDSLYI